MTNFYHWKECYNRWLRVLYINFIFCCHKHKRYNKIDWKNNQNYTEFCLMLYESSSGKIVDMINYNIPEESI
jgi:hypothetical protein